jgi:hypothetical protein
MTEKDTKLPHRGDGHWWCATASPLVERCGRAGCKAMRQYVNGVWVEPQPRKPQVPTPVAEQAQLWT